MTKTTIEYYHAHFYYDVEFRSKAAEVRGGLARQSWPLVQIGSMVDRPIGPHTKCMFEADFPASELGRIVPWIMLNRSGFSVLLHPVTGDEIKDHFDHAVWFGNPLPLDASRLV